jgi:hypothetical protein
MSRILVNNNSLHHFHVSVYHPLGQITVVNYGALHRADSIPKLRCLAILRWKKACNVELHVTSTSRASETEGVAFVNGTSITTFATDISITCQQALTVDIII